MEGLDVGEWEAGSLKEDLSFWTNFISRILHFSF